MFQLWQLVKKEFLLLIKDPQGLLLLFLMPAIFIIIMTFALQNQYAANISPQLDYYSINHDSSAASKTFLDRLAKLDGFEAVPATQLAEVELTRLTAQDKVKFLVFILPDFQQHLANLETAVEIQFAPSTSPAITSIVESQLRNQLSWAYLQQQSGNLLSGGLTDTKIAELDELLRVSSLYHQGDHFPSSVQQNVPAWLLFAMFFIAIPLSTTIINERQQGTAKRLQSMGIGPGLLLAGKFAPWFLINQLQAGLMLLIGIFVVPLLGGDALGLGQQPYALLMIIAAASIAAVTYALFVAQVARTIEQATIFSAVFNIVMAAIGGIMVPRFVMPAGMQALSEISPMAWGLDGFFDILLRGGGLAEVLPESMKLLAFSLLMVCLTLIVSRTSWSATN